MEGYGPSDAGLRLTHRASDAGSGLREVPVPALGVAVFVAGTVALAALSRRSLRIPSSHGFPRFFAFEGVLLLLVLNIPHWLDDPLSPRQLVAWAALAASGVLVLWSVLAFRRTGRVSAEDMPGPEYTFERTSRLLTTGVYRWIRHPMYASILYLAWGAALKHVTPTTLAAAFVTTVAVSATARLEEREDVARFGEEYREYMRKTRRFVPLVW